MFGYVVVVEWVVEIVKVCGVWWVLFLLVSVLFYCFLMGLVVDVMVEVLVEVDIKVLVVLLVVNVLVVLIIDLVEICEWLIE